MSQGSGESGLPGMCPGRPSALPAESKKAACPHQLQENLLTAIMPGRVIHKAQGSTRAEGALGMKEHSDQGNMGSEGALELSEH